MTEHETVTKADVDAKIITHAGLPTVHQDAPALIAAHAGISDAHHTPPTPRPIATGSFTGNNGESQRQITTGFKCSKVIIITGSGAIISATAIPSRTEMETTSANSSVEGSTRCQLHPTNGFYVSGDDNHYFNDTGITYYYWAISE